HRRRKVEWTAVSRTGQWCCRLRAPEGIIRVQGAVRHNSYSPWPSHNLPSSPSDPCRLSFVQQATSSDEQKSLPEFLCSLCTSSACSPFSHICPFRPAYTPSDTVDLDLKGSACTALWVLALQPVLPHAPAFAFQPDFWRQRDGADGHSHRLKHHERKMLRGTTSWTARAQRRARSQVRDGEYYHITACLSEIPVRVCSLIILATFAKEA
ncbi:hypothetical protein V8E36_009356, partial [Tilletia maclaganii]